MPMRCRFLTSALVGAALIAADGRSTTADPSSPPPSPGVSIAANTGLSGPIDPANFASKIDNPWYPLPPGTTLTYEGIKDDKRAVEVLTVTSKTKVIEGVTCLIVEDKVSLGGSPAERALSYYAQDRQGNVWIFGEDSQEIEHGRVVKTEGWQAGVDGALPSFFMEAAPTIGHSFEHQYTSNDFEVVSLSESVKVPYGSFTDALLTKEWSPEEPDVLTHKYYARGLGEVRDVTVKGPREEFVLVQVAR
jgi:hypothetical protein